MAPLYEEGLTTGNACNIYEMKPVLVSIRLHITQDLEVEEMGRRSRLWSIIYVLGR